MRKILIIEDDIALSSGITLALKCDDFAFTQSFTIKDGLKAFLDLPYDLIILDVNLPDGNGMEFLKEIRKTSAVPVILLTANDLETDIVSGLELGADDYITKPFSLAVLRARVNTQLKKHTKITVFEFSGLRFNFDKMEYTKYGKPIELSKTEQKLLRLFVENKGITLARENLVDKIWTDGAMYVDENALSVTVKRLRDKLEDLPSTPKYIKTVYGIGYVWAVEQC